MATTKPFEFFVQWHLTENCNLWCRHCYQGERSTEELLLSEIARGVSEVSDMIRDWSEAYEVAFSPSMNITGGEPFLRKDLFEVLGEIKRQGFKVYLLTNGTLINRDRARKLADLAVDGVQVSVEGPEHVHDAIRGKGSFAASTDGIERLVDAGVPVTLNVTLSKINASSIKKIVAFGSHSGACRIGFSRLVPAGKGRALLSRMLTREQVRDIYEALFALELKGIEIVTGDPAASQVGKTAVDDAGDVAVSGCSAGVAGLTILPNGTVTPCRRLPLALGNIAKDSLREIWATSPILGALRDRSQYKGKCRTCRRWAQCRGCRAIAYACSRARGEDDFLAEDPQCFIST